MKKVLALVLAVMMLATVAFAVTDPGTDTVTYGKRERPGATIEINAAGIIKKAQDEKDAGGDGPVYKFVDSSYNSTDTEEPIKDLNSTNYSITSIKYNDGKNLVDAVKFDDANDKVKVVLKQDYTNTKAKTLNMSFKLKGKKVGKSVKPADIEVVITRQVGYTLNDTAITVDSGSDDAALVSNFYTKDIIGNKNVLFEVGGNGYGTLEFTADDLDTEIEVRVYDGDKLYLYNDVDAKTDVLKKFADNDADITFLNFPGEPTFNATATVRFYKEEGTYIYAWKDGKLSAVTAATAAAGSAGQIAGNVKWDEDEGCYILKTRTLAPTYVFSDKPLAVDTATDTTTPDNPDTGANDVVGIATALAAVALVSAAAVSLKK